MALAIDASTPTMAASATSTWTTASFTPPTNSLLVVVGTGDWFGGTPTLTVTSSGLTFRQLVRTGGTNFGVSELHYCLIGAAGGSARTVSVATSLSGSPAGAVKVYVLTGFHTLAPFDGVYGVANILTDPYSFTGNVVTANSLFLSAGLDWNNTGVIASTDSVQNPTSPGGIQPAAIWKGSTSSVGSETLNWNPPSGGILTITGAIIRPDTAATPAIYKVDDRGSITNITAATTSVVTLTSPTAIATGNYLIARLAIDNANTNGVASTITVTDPRSNSWTVVTAVNDPGAASAGTQVAIAYAKVTTAYQAADTITYNYGGVSTTAKAIVVEEWAGIDATTPTISNTTATGSSTAVAISRTPTAANQLVYAAVAIEGSPVSGHTYTLDTDTTDGNWLPLTSLGSASGTATSNQWTFGAYKLVSGTSAQTWNSTITSLDWAAAAIVFQPTTGTSLTLSKASETDAALAPTLTKSLTLDVATETDAAPALSITKSRTVTLSVATETDSASALSYARAATLGRAQETDTAYSVVAARTIGVSVATETDAAHALTVTKSRSVTLGVATETDTALGLTPTKTEPLGRAQETDSAFTISYARAVTLGRAQETDTALSLSTSAGANLTLGRAQETDTAYAISYARVVTLAKAQETETAYALSVTKARFVTLGVAQEVDTAHAVFTVRRDIKITALGDPGNQWVVTDLVGQTVVTAGPVQTPNWATGDPNGTWVFAGPVSEPWAVSDPEL